MLEKVRKKTNHISCLENIDIGGITLLRAAAKNYTHVTVISNTSKYSDILSHLKENDGKTTQKFRLNNAIEAFSYSSDYDKDSLDLSIQIYNNQSIYSDMLYKEESCAAIMLVVLDSEILESNKKTN